MHSKRAEPVRLLTPHLLGVDVHTVLDAGGDTSFVLTAALYRCMDCMAPGQILEVICRTRSYADILEWCSLEGHEILAVYPEGEVTLYWMRKRDRP